MNRAIKYIFLVFFVCSSGWLIALESGGAGASKPVKKFDKDSPQKLAEQQLAEGASPVKRARGHIGRVDERYGDRPAAEHSRRHMVLAVYDLGQAAQSEQAQFPEYRDAIGATAAQAQRILLGHPFKRLNPGTPEYYEQYDKSVRPYWRHGIFSELGRWSGDIPMPFSHIFVGDENARGKHFLRAQEDEDAFRSRSTEHGFSVIQNVETFVEYGRVTEDYEKTVLPMHSRSLSETQVLQAIKAVEFGEYRERAHASSRSFGVVAELGGVPLEVFRKSGDIATAYPLFAYVTWEPGESKLLIARVSRDGVETPLAVDRDSILLFAQGLIDHYNPADKSQENPIRYLTDDRTAVIVDLAEALHAMEYTNVARGIYIKIPIDALGRELVMKKIPTYYFA